MNHTPGPWNITKLASPAYSPEFGIYADFSPVDLARTMNDNSEANAALICAAPRMSDALKRAAHLLAELPDPSLQLLALRSEIVACIQQATPEYYGEGQ